MVISESRDTIFLHHHSQLDVYSLLTFDLQYEQVFGCYQSKNALSIRIDENQNHLKILTHDKKVVQTLDIETRKFLSLMKHDCPVHAWNYFNGIFFETIVIDK